jgi:hypothetical protein
MNYRREFSLAVRQTALERAGFRCQQCGERERLELHHVGHRSDRSAFNCQVLCASCHRSYHRELSHRERSRQSRP